MNSTATALQWFSVNMCDCDALGEGPARLLGALRAHARRHGRAWPRQSTLGRELGCSVRTIRRWLRVLEDEGIIEVQRTGRSNVVTLPGDRSDRTQGPLRPDTMADRNKEMKETGERSSVRSTEPLAAVETDPTTTPSPLDETELPSPAELREERALASEREVAWSQAAPESQEREACVIRRRWCDTRLAWLEDVRRVAEAVEKLPGWRGHRGTGGVRSIGDLWRLRMEFDRMPSDVWRRSVMAWCRHHTKHPHRRIGDLGGWLLRERCEELPPMPDCPELPPMPPSSETIETESEPLILYRCRHDEGACQFYRVATEEGEEPPGCVWCGDPMVACD